MKFVAVCCLPLALGALGPTAHSGARAVAISDVAPAPGLPYLPSAVSLLPARKAALSWDELYRRAPGLKERIEAMKRAHPEVKDWDALMRGEGRPPSVNDLFNQFPELRAFLNPEPPTIQTPFARREANPPGDGAISIVPPARPNAALQNPLLRPRDRSLFQHENPLLTPDTPVHLNLVQTSAATPKATQ